MTQNEMKLRRRSPGAFFPPTIEALFAVNGGLRISPNLLKTWWSGTELNRRRQPFQCALPMAIFVERAPMRMAGTTGLEPAASAVTV